MSLRDYVSSLQAAIAAAPFVTTTSLAFEERPPSGGFIKGQIVFIDGSLLDFKEFLITQPTVQIVKYGYHYRRGSSLIFRYDNASDPAAKSLSTFPLHKHVPAGLLSAEQPSLEQVLQEIVLHVTVP